MKKLCNICGKLTDILDFTGCKDCGESREDAAKRLHKEPRDMKAGVDFIPNRSCSHCCPTSHGLKSRKVPLPEPPPQIDFRNDSPTVRRVVEKLANRRGVFPEDLDIAEVEKVRELVALMEE